MNRCLLSMLLAWGILGSEMIDAQPIHVIAFNPGGTELPLRDAIVIVSPVDGEPIRPPIQRLTANPLVELTGIIVEPLLTLFLVVVLASAPIVP